VANEKAGAEPQDEIERAIYAAAFAAMLQSLGRQHDWATDEVWGYANQCRETALNAVAWHRLAIGRGTPSRE
jgi:hypothetical protein